MTDFTPDDYIKYRIDRATTENLVGENAELLS
jgi:hypothetical protein